MNTNIDDCLVLNTQAIILVQLGYCGEAILCIKEALTLLQPHFRESPEQQQMDANYLLGNHNRLYCSIPIIPEASVQASSLLSNDNIFSFYPRMFNITERDASKFGASKLFVLLLYNLAFAYHVHAALLDVGKNGCATITSRESSQSRHCRLTSILKMYQSIIVAARTCLRPEEVGGLLCIVIAAANNAGHLNACMNNFQEMQSSLNLELQLMGLSYGPCSIPDTDYEIFFSSIFVFLEGPGLCIAPAA